MGLLSRVLLVMLAIAGFLLTAVAMERWSPESLTQMPEPAAARAQAAADAQALGYRITGEPWIGVSTGHRQYHASEDVTALTEQVLDPDVRRRLLAEAPPLRLGVRYWRSYSPHGREGALFLEYGPGGRLLGATFGMDGEFAEGIASESDRLSGDRLARIFLGREPPEPLVWSTTGLEERIYVTSENEPAIYVALTPRGAWLAMRIPAPYRVIQRQSVDPWSQSPQEQVRFYVLFGAALAALGVLLWRLGRHRAGLRHTLPVLVVLIVTVLPALFYFRSRPSVLVVLSLFFLLPQFGLLLAWAVAEAEMRDVRPRTVVHWDRFLLWRPVKATGGQLLVGLALGCGLAALLATSGRLAEALGDGGYGGVLVRLPDYFMMSTPIHLGFVLTILTAFFVGLGGRLGGRFGAMVGAAISACGWGFAVPVAPLGWNFALAWVAAMAAGWVLWHHGLLALVMACITAVSLPTAWFAWSATPLMTSTALLSSTPALLAAVGVWWWLRAPERAEGQAIVPPYVSDFEREARLAGEVSLLRDFQLALMPPERPCARGLDLAWRMVVADVVGGDFLDLVDDEEGRVWIAVADVAGHGVSCSVLTAYTKAAVAQHAIAGRGPAEALGQIRGLFSRLRTRRTLVTLLLAVWDPRDRSLRVATAGHPHLLTCYDGAVAEVGCHGPPLGSALATRDREATVHCPPGTVLVAYTDGVAEAASPSGDLLGYDLWPQHLPSVANLPEAADVLAQLLGTVDQHCAGRPKEDDVTVLVAKVVG